MKSQKKTFARPRARLLLIFSAVSCGWFHWTKMKKEAVSLIETYGASRGLRTLDAMQLALMKTLGAEALTRVYCADRRFYGIIEEEGFAVLDPEQPPKAERKSGEE